jgi:hypothetical protein
MDDAKRAYRETEENTKEAWRNRDGEDLADKVGNLGDDIRKHLGNAGDDARDTIDPAGDGVAIDDPDVAPANRPY